MASSGLGSASRGPPTTNSLLCVLSAGAEATVAGAWRGPGQTYVRARGTTSKNGLHRETSIPTRIAGPGVTRPIFMRPGAAERHENLRRPQVDFFTDP